MTETDLMWDLVRRIPHAIPDARPFRRAVVNVEAKQGFRVKAGIKGQCDLYLYVRGGRVLEVETKARRGVLSERQLAWQAFCRSLSIPHIVLTQRADESTEDTVQRWIVEITKEIASWR